MSRKNVCWLRFHLPSRKRVHLPLIASGVASSYTGDRSFHLIDLDDRSVLTVEFRKGKVLPPRIRSILKNASDDDVKEFISNARLMCFLMTDKKSLPENLTSEPGWNIICIYVTLSRNRFEQIQTDDNIRKCLVRISAVVNSTPEIIEKYWG